MFERAYLEKGQDVFSRLVVVLEGLQDCVALQPDCSGDSRHNSDLLFPPLVSNVSNEQQSRPSD